MILPDAMAYRHQVRGVPPCVAQIALPSSVVDLPYNTFQEAYVDCAVLTTHRMSARNADDDPKIAIGSLSK